MYFTMEDVAHVFSVKDQQRGMMSYMRKQVHDLRVDPTPDGAEITCSVQDSIPRMVHLFISGEKASCRCSCTQFQAKHLCQHVAAAMIACTRLREEDLAVETDHRARQILQTYRDRPPQASAPPAELMRIVPRMDPRENGYPRFSFQVGGKKLYVIKDVRKFVENVLNRQTASYGKGLTLLHAPEQFDEPSRALLSLLTDQFQVGRSVIESPYWGYLGGDFSMNGVNGQKNMLCLMGSAFDKMFDLYEGRQIDSAYKKVSYTFSTQDPAVSLSVARMTHSARLQLSTDDIDWHFFGSADMLYAWGGGQIIRCSGAFRRDVYPLLENGTGEMRISEKDLPVFCSCVLPEIENAVQIDDPTGVLSEFLPDICTPCFRFDMDGELLTLQLNYRYNDITFNCFGEPGAPVKRDNRAEQAAQELAARELPGRKGRLFFLEDSDAIYTLVTERLTLFHNMGEVFVTDRLRARRLQPTRATVGISVADGMLTLDFDTGGFPPEELEALYQSLVQRKRFHRLANGQYLPLNGSACETVAEMAHMLRLGPKEIAEGKLEMPAFRALYLDDLLSGHENIEVRRSRTFREMIRQFRAPEEEYPLPLGMEGTLRPYQKVGYQWLKTLAAYGFGGLLADEMGLGKTLQMIAFLASLDPAQRTGPSLIVCPASLVYNWADELDRFAPSVPYTLILGTAAERARLIDAGQEKEVWVTSYELLRQDIEHYAPLHFTCCVLDEGQHIKNQSTLASKAVKRIDCGQRFVLTGTPIENRLSELWNLFDFLMPGYLFSHREFVEKLEKPAVKSGDAEALSQLRRMVQPFLLRRLKRDVLKELPPKIEHVRRISLSEAERKVYYAASAAARRTLDESGEGGKLAVLAALTRLRQICCAPNLCFENYDGPSSKLEACVELCTGMVENGHQVLLFSQFTSMLDRLRAKLDEAHISHCTLEGATPKEKRAQLVRDFNAGKASVFLISLKAGGTGLNLTAADVVIHYDPWWNPAAQDQATDRAHRIGQQASVQVYKLIAKDTIEEKILDLQDKKSALLDTVTDAESGGILNMSREELLALFD